MPVYGEEAYFVPWSGSHAILLRQNIIDQQQELQLCSKPRLPLQTIMDCSIIA